MFALNGGLIQMNAHMVMSDSATRIIALGLVVTIVFGLLAAFISRNERKMALVGLALAFVGLVIVIIGARQPKVREIRACASGQVSIEQISSVYDIVSIDGKELVLRER